MSYLCRANGEYLMFPPDRQAPCPDCSFQAGHIDGPVAHLRRQNGHIIHETQPTEAQDG